MNKQPFSLGQVLAQAHENTQRAANILARRMAQRAIEIAQKNPNPPMSNGSSINAVSRLALARISAHTLARELLPIAQSLIDNHGAGHRVHDMNAHFWELGNDSAIELICECLRINGLDEIADYISDKTIRRHVLHDPARLQLLDAGYTHNSALSGSHHSFDSFWKGHNTKPKTGSKEGITSILYLDKYGTVIPLIEGDRVVEKPDCVFLVKGNTVVVYSRPQKRQYPNTLDVDGNISPNLYHEAIESRHGIRDSENMITEVSTTEMIKIKDIDTNNLVIDNGQKIRHTPWTLYTLTQKGKRIFVYINERDTSQSFHVYKKKDLERPEFPKNLK